MCRLLSPKLHLFLVRCANKGVIGGQYCSGRRRTPFPIFVPKRQEEKGYLVGCSTLLLHFVVLTLNRSDTYIADTNYCSAVCLVFASVTRGIIINSGCFVLFFFVFRLTIVTYLALVVAATVSVCWFLMLSDLVLVVLFQKVE